MYPLKIKLTKSDNNEFEKYGLMWEHSLPKVGQKFMVLVSKLLPTYITSAVTEIVEQTKQQIVFKTLNSIYKLEIEK